MKIISNNINAIQLNEVSDFMRRLILESLYSLEGLSDIQENVEWYKNCTMDEYFTEWVQIWDEDDDFIGEGLDTIAHKFVLNDDTRPSFMAAFEQARRTALEEYEEYKKE